MIQCCVPEVLRRADATRSVWSARSLLPLFIGEANPSTSKAPASRTRLDCFVLGILIFCCLVVARAAETGQPASAAQKARILLVTGIDYPGHLWRQTAPVLARA